METTYAQRLEWHKARLRVHKAAKKKWPNQGDHDTPINYHTQMIERLEKEAEDETL